jgi:hypothetical protein
LVSYLACRTYGILNKFDNDRREDCIGKNHIGKIIKKSLLKDISQLRSSTGWYDVL